MADRRELLEAIESHGMPTPRAIELTGPNELARFHLHLLAHEWYLQGWDMDGGVALWIYADNGGGECRLVVPLALAAVRYVVAWPEALGWRTEESPCMWRTSDASGLKQHLATLKRQHLGAVIRPVAVTTDGRHCVPLSHLSPLG